MSNYKPVPEGKDPILWEIAQRRASFKNHVSTYVIVNIFLWAVWYFTGAITAEPKNIITPGQFGLPWDGALALRFIMCRPM